MMPTTAVTTTVMTTEKSVKNTHEPFSFRKHVKATWGNDLKIDSSLQEVVR